MSLFFVKCCLAMPHVSVYVDESGDAGFDDKTSEFFTVGYAFAVDGSAAKENKTVKRALKNINAGSKMKISEFKFSANTDVVRRRFLKTVNGLDADLGVFCVSKDSVKPDLKKGPYAFYEHAVVDTIAAHLVEDYIRAHDHDNSVSLTIDRSLAENARHSFDEYCRNKIHDKMRVIG